MESNISEIEQLPGDMLLELAHHMEEKDIRALAESSQQLKYNIKNIEHPLYRYFLRRDLNIRLLPDGLDPKTAYLCNYGHTTFRIAVWFSQWLAPLNRAPDFIVTKRADEPEYLSEAVVEAFEKTNPAPQQFRNYPPNFIANPWTQFSPLPDSFYQGYMRILPSVLSDEEPFPASVNYRSSQHKFERMCYKFYYNKDGRGMGRYGVPWVRLSQSLGWHEDGYEENSIS